MRIVVACCSMIIAGAIRPEILAWDYHPPGLFLGFWCAAMGVGVCLDVLDAAARIMALREKGDTRFKLTRGST